MKNRERVLRHLNAIVWRCQHLKEMINDKSDQELENIFISCFDEYTTNILANSVFLEILISRVDEEAYNKTGRKVVMTNEELEEYFRDHRDRLICDCI